MAPPLGFSRKALPQLPGFVYIFFTKFDPQPKFWEWTCFRLTGTPWFHPSQSAHTFLVHLLNAADEHIWFSSLSRIFVQLSATRPSCWSGGWEAMMPEKRTLSKQEGSRRYYTQRCNWWGRAGRVILRMTEDYRTCQAKEYRQQQRNYKMELTT